VHNRASHIAHGLSLQPTPWRQGVRGYAWSELGGPHDANFKRYCCQEELFSRSGFEPRNQAPPLQFECGCQQRSTSNHDLLVHPRALTDETRVTLDEIGQKSRTHSEGFESEVLAAATAGAAGSGDGERIGRSQEPGRPEDGLGALSAHSGDGPLVSVPCERILILAGFDITLKQPGDSGRLAQKLHEMVSRTWIDLHELGTVTVSHWNALRRSRKQHYRDKMHLGRTG
jgi:hypothetical protein